jgi:flagellar protein FliO/FliZ
VIPFLLAQADAATAAGPDLMPSLWRTLGALTVVLGLLGLLAYALRRGVMVKRGKGQMGVETVLALGDRRSLVIVVVENRRLLLGVSPGGVSLVTELQAPPTFEQTIAGATARGPS